jgi:predicted MFS family arabinose efflux permease
VDEAHRGRIIGNIMSGLMIGILLSRPISSLGAAAFGWRGAYAFAAIAVAVVAVAMQRVLPRLAGSRTHICRADRVAVDAAVG